MTQVLTHMYTNKRDIRTHTHRNSLTQIQRNTEIYSHKFRQRDIDIQKNTHTKIPVRYPTFFSIPDPTQLSFENHLVSGS